MTEVRALWPQNRGARTCETCLGQLIFWHDVGNLTIVVPSGGGSTIGRCLNLIVTYGEASYG
jgi:hypothetical protein